MALITWLRQEYKHVLGWLSNYRIHCLKSYKIKNTLLCKFMHEKPEMQKAGDK